MDMTTYLDTIDKALEAADYQLAGAVLTAAVLALELEGIGATDFVADVFRRDALRRHEASFEFSPGA